MQIKKKLLSFLFIWVLAQQFLAQEAKIIVKDSGNENITCTDLNGGCTTLEAMHIPANRTTDYSYSEIPYQPIGDKSTLGTVFKLKDINEYSDPIEIGFNFNFYNNDFNSVLINENGFLSFDFRNIGLVDVGDPLRAIMGVYQDLIIIGDEESDIFYKTEGVAPHREFIVTFYNALAYFCPNSNNRSTTQIRLKELSNEVEVHIQEKSINCGVGLNSILGISNDVFTESVFAVGKGEGSKWEAREKSFKFSPIGKSVVSYKWYRGESLSVISTEKRINVCPIKEEATEYRVQMNYNAFPMHTEIDTIKVMVPVITDLVLPICEITGLNLINIAQKMIKNSETEPFKYSFFDGATKIENPEDYSFTDTQKDIKVVLETISGGCQSSAKLKIVTTNPFGLLKEELEICDNIYVGNDKDIEPNYNLSDLSKKIIANYLTEINSSIKLDFYSDAGYTNKLSDKEDLKDGDILYVGYKSSFNCIVKLGEIKIKLKKSPTVTSVPGLLNIKLCDINFDKKEDLFDENGKRIKLIDLLLGSGLTVSDENTTISVFTTYRDALENRNSVNQIKSSGINSVQDFYVRVENKCLDSNCDSCFSIYDSPIKIKISFFGVELNTLNTIALCSDSESVSFDLSCLKESMFVKAFKKDGTFSENINDVKVTYHDSKKDAESGINPINSELTNLTYGLHEYYIRYELCDNCAQGNKSCYSSKPVSLFVTNAKPDNSKVSVCVGSGENIILKASLFTKQLFKNSTYYNIAYYKTKEDAEKQENQLSTLEVSNDVDLYVRVEVKPHFLQIPTSCAKDNCGVVIEEFKVSVVDNKQFKKLIEITEQVCNNDFSNNINIDLTSYNSLVLNGVAEPEKYRVTYYKENNVIDSPTTFNYTITEDNQPNVIHLSAKISSPLLKCDVNIPIVVNVTYLPQIYIDNWVACACMPSLPIQPYVFRGDELKGIIKDMYSETANSYELKDMEVTFYSNINGTGYSNAYNKIDPIKDFDSTTPDFDLDSEIQVNEVFVRFENKNTGCFSIAKLKLNNLLLPNVRDNVHYVCDDDFDKVNEINLLELNKKVLDFGEYTPIFLRGGVFQFSYFYSEEDALTNTNPIIPSKVDKNNNQLLEVDFSLLKDDLIWVRVDTDEEGACENKSFNKDDCKSIESVKLVPSLKRITNNIGKDLSIQICEDNAAGLYPTDEGYNDGVVTGLNLTEIEAELRNNIPNIDKIYYYAKEEDIKKDDYSLGVTTIKNITEYTNKDENGVKLSTFYVKYSSKNEEECSNYISVNIDVIKPPIIYPQKKYMMCEGSSINVELLNPNNEDLNNFNFIWTDTEGNNYNSKTLPNVTKYGAYYVQIENKLTGCITPNFQFEVVPVDSPVIESINVNNYSAVINAKGYEGIGLEYSLEGVEWQESNLFKDLKPGIHTFYVRYNNYNKSCVSEPKQTIILDIKNVITPNGDGKNDFWEIKNLEILGGESSVQIFDRNGVKIYEEKGTSLKWNGKTKGGQKLPTTDYWYVLKLSDGQVYKGHITVKNK